MKKIFLVRHGESEWNVLKKIQGQQDVPLTDRGNHQAHLIGNRLLGKKIDSIYSSDLQRAYDTATVIGNKLQIQVKPMAGLREINFGQWEGMSYDEACLKKHKEILLWRKAPEKLNIDGVESLKELQQRSMIAINKIIDNETGKNILVVSHSATLKAIILGLLNMNLSNFKKLTLDNVSLTIVEFRNYNRVLKVLNDTSHIREI